jgi:cellulose synthase/poly-beta-1,6-N-acetylglucosamine synthase-like glycosyltransferase
MQHSPQHALVLAAAAAAGAVQVGWFPEWTITEDYALSLQLKAGGVHGRYLPLYLAVSSQM